MYNILIVDERFEITSCSNNEIFDGKYIDIILGASKKYAFHEGLKSMNPSLIITDEISEIEDLSEIMEVSRCGVKIIATAHAENVEQLKKRECLKKILDIKVFERIVVLSKRKGLGTIEAVYDENLKGI